MNEILFFTSLILLILGFFKREKISSFFLYNLNLKISVNAIMVILTILFVALITAGMLLDNTKEKYGHISNGYDGFKPKDDDRPHRYFDVNTYD